VAREWPVDDREELQDGCQKNGYIYFLIIPFANK
jgi:hypothetical protein